MIRSSFGRLATLLPLVLTLSVASFAQQAVKNVNAGLKAKSGADALYYYYLDERIALTEVEGLRAWGFATATDAKAAALALGAPNKMSRQTAGTEAPAGKSGVTVAARGNLAAMGYLIVDPGSNNAPAELAALASHAAALKVKGDMPVYMSRYTAPRHKPLVIPPQILIKWNDAADAGQRASLKTSHNLTLLEEQLGGVMLYDVAGGAAQPAQTLAAANALVESGAAQFAHPNFIYQIDRMERSPRGSAAADLTAFLRYAEISAAALGTNDTYFPQQWHLNNRGFNTIDEQGVPGADISATRAWTRLGSVINNGIKVAVLDDGLDTAHEDMQGQFLPGRNYMTSPPNDVVTPDSVDSHGCATSGLIGATGDNSIGVAGVAHRTDTKIIHVRIFDQNGATSDANIGLGLRWAADNGADVLSNSWGGGSPSSNITDAITHAVTNGRGGKGAPCLFASGNDYLPLSYPAFLNNVISVGGTTDQDQHVLYADFGPDLDIVAPTYDGDFNTPGIPEFERSGIWTIDNSGSKGYNTGSTANGDAAGNYFKWFSGTSASTPIAAGVAALVLQHQPELTWEQVRSRLRHTADKAPTRSSYDDNGFSPFFGYGRVNAFQAINDITPPPANYNMRTRVIFDDDFNSGNQGWTAQTPWAIANISGRMCWTESPAGNYQNDMNTNLVSPPIDLSHSRATALEVVINHEIEVWPDFFGFLTPWDFLYIEASNDGGTWTMLKLLTGETRRGASGSREFVTLRFDLSAFDFSPVLLIRFRFTSDESNTYDGVAIDRVRVLATAESPEPHFQVTSATGRPVWIRAGRELAFLNGAQLLSQPIAAGRLGFPLFDGASNTIQSISASAARDYLYYIVESGGNFSVERIGWDGENSDLILIGAANPRKSIAVNPAATQICWAQDGNIQIANANGSGETTLVNAAAQSIVDPDNITFSANGQRVYFDAETAPGNRDLYVIDTNGSNFWRLTDTTDMNEVQPDPDPREQRLAFAWSAAANPAVKNISMITNLPDNRLGTPAHIAPLITSHADDSAPRWSPRGDLLAYLRNGAQLWVAGAQVINGSHPEVEEFYPISGSTTEEVLDGWVSGGAAPIFPLPNFINTSDAVGIEGAEFFSFGYWLSPDQTVADSTEDLLIARFNFSSGLSPCDQPQIRARALASNLSQGNVLGLISINGCDAMPVASPRPYYLPFQPIAGAVGQTFRMAFDLLNFDPADAVAGHVFLHDVTVWQMNAGALGAGRAEKSYTFDSSDEGWLSGSAAPILSAPIFDYAGGQLTMTAVSSVDTFGFWQSPGDVTIENGRMYQIVYTVNEDDRPEAANSVQRLRAFTSDGQSYVYQEQPFQQQFTELEIAPTDSRYSLYFTPPYAATGAKLHVALDLTNFNPAAPADVTLGVDAVEIVSFPLPIE